MKISILKMVVFEILIIILFKIYLYRIYLLYYLTKNCIDIHSVECSLAFKKFKLVFENFDFFYKGILSYEQILS